MYYPIPFPFDKILAKKKRQGNLSLEDSIRSNIRFLIFTRLGEFAYDRKLGFEIWDRDKEVFYREKRMYYEAEIEENYQGTMEDSKANKYFVENLHTLIEKNEPRIRDINASYEYVRIRDEHAKFQRQIVIEIECRIKSTGILLNPPIKLTLLYSPFKVKMK